jgi:DNA repair protein RecO (recombination protein O)
MEWQDEGIVLGVRPHGETSAVVEVLTREHGRHLGLVMGGRSRRLRPILQTGNHVDLRWRARLEDHLGHMTLELRQSHAANLLDNSKALNALTSLAALAHLLPERDPHPNLYEVTLFVLDLIGDKDMLPALLVRWELALLADLGFGLDLSQCAASGANDGLIYVSPKTGRAISASAGEPYKDRLLALPAFLRPREGQAGRTPGVTAHDIAVGFALTGYFLDTRVLEPRGAKLPDSRGRLIASL